MRGRLAAAWFALGLGSVVVACATEVGPSGPSGVGSSGAGGPSAASGASASGRGASSGSGNEPGSGSSAGQTSGTDMNGSSGSSVGTGSGTQSTTPVDDAGAGGSDDSTMPPASTGGDAPDPKFIPAVKGTCPTLATGVGTFAGEPVQLWVGKPTADEKGPLLLYWHATGTNSAEASSFFGQAQIDDITAAGGMVASFAKSTGTGTNTGDAVWYTDDFNTADQVVACAIADLHIDTRHIYTAGGSAGALQAVWMAYARSGYIAAAGPISGGLDGLGNGSWLTPINTPQDPTSVPSGFAAHGAPGADVVIIDFAVASAGWEADIKKKGGFSVDCNNGGGHVGTAGIVGPAMWEYFKSHPFKTKVDPYANGLPADFPKFCQLGPRAADGGAP